MSRLTSSAFMLILACGVAFLGGCGSKERLAITPPAESGGGTKVAEGPQFTAEEQRASGILSSSIYFAYDRFDLSPEAKANLEGKASTLKEFPRLRVIIEGHCDERGTEEYNMALAERRARAAFAYLTLLGVRPNQIEMISYGKMHPAVSGHSEKAWSRNRRCEFQVGLI